MSPCIWYVSKYVITPKPGDPAGRAYGLMRELGRRGYQSVIVTSDSMGKHDAPKADRSYVIEHADGMTLCRARTLKYNDSNAVRRVLSWFDFERKLFRMPKWALPKPDVVVVSSLSLLTIFNGLLWRRRFGCRLVFEVRDIWPLTIVEEGGYSARNPFVMAMSVIERFAYKRADEIIGTMPNLAMHVSEVTGRQLQVHCIPMGVDVEAMRTPEPLRPGYVDAYIPKDQFVIAYAGSLGISNAMDVFFECVKTLKDEALLHFVVLGDGEMRQSYVDRYGSLPNLTFAPRVPKAQVHDFLTRCDVVYLSVHRSKVWEYGLSLNKLVDYMMAAKPVIASYSGHKSMIDEARCGIFVPAGDVASLRKAFIDFSQADPASIVEMGQQGKAWLVENRNYSLLASKFAEILLGHEFASNDPAANIFLAGPHAFKDGG